ncbi:MAG: hypothetical protein P4L81_06870 [Candidatus Pacebacteria bacterium]|nr:hypothetical protein [Candidatus Paceibacterota bacterium]
MTFSKHNDVEAVMIKAARDLEAIENEYQKSLNAQTVPDSLLVEVKDCLGNLRSALDYLWCKIPGAGKNAHFPVANSLDDFANKTPNIDAKYVVAIEEWQPYTDNPWLGHFNLLRNKHAHLTLVPQKRVETKEFSVKGKDASVTMRGTTFQGSPGASVIINVGGTDVPINMDTGFPADVPGVDIKRTIWIDFLFDGSSISSDFPTDISVLPFLRDSLYRVAEIIEKVELIM